MTTTSAAGQNQIRMPEWIKTPLATLFVLISVAVTGYLSNKVLWHWSDLSSVTKRGCIVGLISSQLLLYFFTPRLSYSWERFMGASHEQAMRVVYGEGTT